ncbi:hypothetical protein ACFTAO_43450 [Paenibacillus rhizoplanae]
MTTLPPNDQEALLSKEFAITINGESFRDNSGKPLFLLGRLVLRLWYQLSMPIQRLMRLQAMMKLLVNYLFVLKTSGSEGKVELGAISSGESILELFKGVPAEKKQL